MKNTSLIEGVKVIPLKQILDERGKIMHMLKRTDPHFIEFGEIYFSVGFPGVIKAWHKHKNMVIHNAAVSGRAKYVLYDARPKSATYGNIMELFIGEDNYCLVQVPPGIAQGYKVIGDKPVIMANSATIPHDPDEMEKIDPFSKEIPYDWSLKHG